MPTPEETQLEEEIAALRDALTRALKTGSSWGTPAGLSGASHSIAELDRMIRDRVVRLARLRRRLDGGSPLEPASGIFE